MGERYTMVVFGCFLKDIVGSAEWESRRMTDTEVALNILDEGFHGFVGKHPQVTRVGRYGPGQGTLWPGFYGVPLLSSYESTPAWCGFRIAIMEYGGRAWNHQTWQGGDSHPEIMAWNFFRAELAKVGIVAPPGFIIVAQDE